MATDPGEWYEEKRLEAERADWAVRHLQAYLRRLDDRRVGQSTRAPLTVYLEFLVRTLERARDVGD